MGFLTVSLVLLDNNNGERDGSAAGDATHTLPVCPIKHAHTSVSFLDLLFFFFVVV